jgi:hypothetical protein
MWLEQLRRRMGLRNQKSASPRNRLGMEYLEERAVPAVISVISTADNNNPVVAVGHAGTAADPFLAPSLRSAISFANANPGADTINLAVAGTYRTALTGTPGETDNAAGEFAVLATGGDLTIENTSGGTAVLDGNHANRVLDINPANTNDPATKILVTLEGLTVTNGVAFDAANPDGGNASGGGIRDLGNASLTLNDVIVTGNVASADGGGIVFENTVSTPWTLTVNNSTISDNHAGDAGGGIDTDGSGKIFITDSSITGNTTVAQGAGIWLDAIMNGADFQTANLTITGSVFSGNSAETGLGGAIGNAGNGVVTIDTSTVDHNYAGGIGGGFGDENAQGTLVVQNSVFLDNATAADGGAIAAGGPATTITGSVLRGNSSVATGGAVFVNGVTLTITNSTIVGNSTAGNGGGIEFQGTGAGAAASTISNSTITGNSALNNGGGNNGGGIDVSENVPGVLRLVNDTVNANFASSGGGLFWIGQGGGQVFQNTIVAGNFATTAGPDVNSSGAAVTDNGGNLIGNAAAGVGFNPTLSQIGVDPLLGPLQDNGGPAVGAPDATAVLQTEALLAGSPARGRGVTTGVPGTDERGFLRPVFARTNSIDVGAFDSTALAPSLLSTVPANGDVNPYGVAFVPQGFPVGGTIQPGDVLVANFNDGANTPGLGTTLVRIDPNGGPAVPVFTSTQPGLTAALGVLKAGFVIVGNIPNVGGAPAAGGLQVIDNNGHLVTTITDPALLNGPWYLTVANDTGATAQAFVSNVLSGTVTRLNLQIANGTVTVVSKTQIASGYAHRLDPAAFVVGPAGLAYDAANNVLYVASSADNAIFKIANAGTAAADVGKGTLVTQDNAHLHGPLGLILAPNGDLITANSDAQNADPNQPSELAEFTTAGNFVAQFPIDPATGGAFGIGLNTANGQFQFAAVDDNAGTITVWGTAPLPTRAVTLNLTVTPPAGTVKMGDTAAFTITVTDTGSLALPADATAVTVTLPAGLTAIDPLTFPVGALAAGHTATFTLHVRATAAGPQTISVVVNSPDTTPATTGPVTATANVTTVPTAGQLPQLIISGPTNGVATVYAADPANPARYNPTPLTTLNPFGNVATTLRSAEADVDGDGVMDTVLVTGPGTPIRVAVVSGTDNRTVLVQPFDPFGGNFTGGGFVAAADLNHDGRAEFVVTPDMGGGPRVSVFSLLPGGVVTRANFFGIDDKNFRGGARVALGDLNGDGTPDLVVAAGFGGGPRIAIFDGTTVLDEPRRLVNDFFAFPGADATNLRNGVFVAAGDVDGDGSADLILGGGPGGAPRVLVLSGKTLVARGGSDAAEAAPLANFFSGDPNGRGGARVAAKTVGGKADVVVGSGEGLASKVRVYDANTIQPFGEPTGFQDLDPFGVTLKGGVFVG